MGILEDLDRRIKRAAKEIEGRGTTKGERQNRRRLIACQEAWRDYSGPMSHREFMSWCLKQKNLRTKKVAKQVVSKFDKECLKIGKTVDVNKLLKIFNKIDIRRTPLDEQHFVDTLLLNVPGLREYGTFKFAGTFHTPDLYVNKDIVFEVKVVRSNTEFHTALGQALIYHYKYDYVFVVLFDARQGYDAVVMDKKEWEFLLEHNIIVIIFPKD